MEIKKEDFELFIQFKQFMATQGSMELSRDVNKKPRREKGTGSVTRLSGKRKRSYLASVTIGYDEYNGKQIQKPLAYFIESKQANKALDIYMLEKDGKCDTGTLLEYIYSVDGSLPKKDRVNTINLERKLDQDGKVNNCPTLKETFNILRDTLWLNKSDNTMSAYKTAFNHFKQFHNTKISQIRLQDIEPIFEELMKKGSSFSKLNNMKIVMSQVYKYGIKYDYVEKNYAKYIQFEETLKSEDKNNKVPYSKEDIKNLFRHDDDIIAQSILVMIYTGTRPSELLQIKKENIHLDERYMIGGIKTKNGIDRVIPIHECIVNYMKEIMESEILGMAYTSYLYKFNMCKKDLNFKCTPHSGRHTFATLANEYKLDEFLVKKIMGHSARDLTKDVYTHIDKERLINEVNKIPTLK